MDKQFFKEYYHLERKHWWFKVRARIIQDQIIKLGLPKDIKILNVGVATFKSSEVLSKYGHVTSLEYDKDCCEFIRSELKQEVINGSALDLPFKQDTFDMVCAFDVVEHINDDKLALSEMERVCKANGIIYITVPAFNFLWSEHDEIAHHFRRYTMRNLLKAGDISKSRILRKTYFNSLLFLPITFMRLGGRLFSKKNNKTSDFDKISKGSFLNVIFEKIFSFEQRLIQHFNFPIGVSILLMYRK